MFSSAIHHHLRPQHSSEGKVSAVLMIETEGTADLPCFLHWLRLARVRRGIVLLADVPHYPQHTLDIIREITALGIDVIPVDFPSGKASGAAAIAKNAFPLPATDMVLSLSHSTTTGGKTLHLGHHSRYDFAALRLDTRFRAATQRLGISAISCSDRSSPLIEGGDYLLVGDHLFIGRRTYDAFGTGAEAMIRGYYGLCDSLHIHFTGVADPLPASGLYHLDLYFTYGGMTETGVHRFFAGYIDETSIGDPLIPDMAAQLDRFHIAVQVLLSACFGEKYILIPVPIIVCDIYRISPLNGIIDYIKGVPTYYFPWPKFINAAEHPEYGTQDRISASVQRAYDIMSHHMGGDSRVLRFDFPISYAAGSGQSLHCTMAVIERDMQGY